MVRPNRGVPHGLRPKSTKWSTHPSNLLVSILITLCFSFRYIENIMFYLSGGVLIYMYKQSNTVY